MPFEHLFLRHARLREWRDCICSVETRRLSPIRLSTMRKYVPRHDCRRTTMVVKATFGKSSESASSGLGCLQLCEAAGNERCASDAAREQPIPRSKGPEEAKWLRVELIMLDSGC